MARCSSSKVTSTRVFASGVTVAGAAVTITNANLGTNWRRWSIQRDPVNAGSCKTLPGKFIIVADDNTIPRCVDGNNIERLAARDADAAALAHGVAMDAT